MLASLNHAWCAVSGGLIVEWVLWANPGSQVENWKNVILYNAIAVISDLWRKHLQSWILKIESKDNRILCFSAGEGFQANHKVFFENWWKRVSSSCICKRNLIIDKHVLTWKLHINDIKNNHTEMQTCKISILSIGNSESILLLVYWFHIHFKFHRVSRRGVLIWCIIGELCWRIHWSHESYNFVVG